MLSITTKPILVKCLVWFGFPKDGSQEQIIRKLKPNKCFKNITGKTPVFMGGSNR